MTAWGLNETWKFVEGPGVEAVIARSWKAVTSAVARTVSGAFRRIFRRHPGPQVILRTASDSASATDSASASVTWGPPGDTVEQRLAWLESHLQGLRVQLESWHQQHSNEIGAIRGELTTEQAARQAGDERAERVVKGFAASGLRVAVFGLLLFLLAATGTTLPVGSAHLFRWFLHLHQPHSNCPSSPAAPT